MEGTPKSFESAERMRDWQELRDEALDKANFLISEIPNFGEISAPEQLEALSHLIDSLASDNENRYVAREVSIEQRAIELKHTYEVGMQAIGRG